MAAATLSMASSIFCSGAGAASATQTTGLPRPRLCLSGGVKVGLQDRCYWRESAQALLTRKVRRACAAQEDESTSQEKPTISSPPPAPRPPPKVDKKDSAMALSLLQFMARSLNLEAIQLHSICNGGSSIVSGADGSRRTAAAEPFVANGMNAVNGEAVCYGGSLWRTDWGKTVQGHNNTPEPAGENHVDSSFTRIGFMAGCAAFGLSSNAAAAAELDPSSSHSLSTDWLHFVSILGDLDPGTAQLATSLAGPFITVFNLLFIFRVVMSWYPGIPVKKFPFFLAYNPTEPVLGPTRRLIPPVGGVDVAPVIWVAIMSFANEILLGKQGLLVLLSQQQS